MQNYLIMCNKTYLFNNIDKNCNVYCEYFENKAKG